MYGKMQASRLTEFIPFICTSTIWGQILFQNVYILNSLFTLRGGRCGGWLLFAAPYPQLLSNRHWGVAASAGSLA